MQDLIVGALATIKRNSSLLSRRTISIPVYFMTGDVLRTRETRHYGRIFVNGLGLQGMYGRALCAVGLPESSKTEDPNAGVI